MSIPGNGGNRCASFRNGKPLNCSAKSEKVVKGAGVKPEAVGNGVRRKLLGFDATLMMVRVDFNSGSIGELHTHPHRQVTYVASGRFEVEINGDKKELEEGDSFIVAPDEPHGVVALEDGTLIDAFTPAREDFLVGATDD